MLEFKKMLRITTHYPALGLFIIGLAFIISAAAFSTPKQPQFKITGKLAMQIDDPSSLIVTIAPPSWQQGRAYDSGDIMALVTPTTEILDVTLSAPGYRQLTFEVQTNQSKFGTLSIGDVTLTKVVDKPMLNTDNIVPAPTGLPSLDKQGAF